MLLDTIAPLRKHSVTNRMTTRDNSVASRDLIEKLYTLLLEEVRNGDYNNSELLLIQDPVLYYGRYLDPRTRNYALYNAVSNLSTAVAYLSSSNCSRRLLDLGCGLGMQSILFAASGWNVLGLDYHPESISLCRKRKAYFERRLGCQLNLEFVARDFRRADPRSLGDQFDAVFSMSAFAQMQPLRDTVSKISTLLSDSGRIFLWEENPGHFFSDLLHFRSRSLPRPQAVREELARHDFETELLSGGCVIPRQLWRPPAVLSLVAALDSLLKRNLALSFTYLLGASRTPTVHLSHRHPSDLLQYPHSAR